MYYNLKQISTKYEDHTISWRGELITTNGNFNGNCNILIGDNDWNHMDSKWIDDCPCSKYSTGDTLELIAK